MRLLLDTHAWLWFRMGEAHLGNAGPDTGAFSGEEASYGATSQKAWEAWFMGSIAAGAHS